jgi:hypothetical protein
MNRFINKIPITFWTIILISIVGLFLYSQEFNTESTNKISIAANLITILGVLFVAIQINKQSKDSIISTEFLNQPNFDFKGVFEETLKNSSPGYCTEKEGINYNKCNDLHWFDFIQTGNLPAKKVKVTLIHEKEKKDILDISKKRTMKFDLVHQNDRHQFKLAPHSIPVKLFEIKENGNLYILLDYISVYSKVRYKRIYKLNYAPKVTPNSIVSDWKDGIRYFDLVLDNFEDSLSISWKLILKNLRNKSMVSLSIKKDKDLKDWLIDI